MTAPTTQTTYNLGQVIYKQDISGRIREWTIDVIDHGHYSEIISRTGIQGSPNHHPTVVPIREGKNIGKSNETTPYQQAVKEALAAAELKLREEYRFRIEDIRPQELRSGIKAPMLAQTYSPKGGKDGKTLKQLKLEGKTIHVQPKYDGNRCMAVVNPQGCTFYTRKGDVMPVTLPHIEAELFNSYVVAGYTNEIVLDGELFSDELPFKALNGLLNKKKPLTDVQRKQADSTYLVLFDVVAYVPYIERHDALQPFASANVRIIPTFEIEATDANIRHYMDIFLGEGHEGLMIRQLDALYEHRRTPNLLKYKDWIESEFKLLDVEEESRGGGLIGGFIMEMTDKSQFDTNGKPVLTFKAGCSWSHPEQKEFFANKAEYIGGMATIKYQLVAGDPRPRFGKFKAMRYDV